MWGPRALQIWKKERLIKGPSIYDVYAEVEGSGSGGRMRMGEGSQLHLDVHTEN